MKKNLLIFLELILLTIGIWLFITNTLASSSNERILAGLGGGMLYFSLILRDIRLNYSICELKIVWKVIITILGIIGVWLFISNTLATGADKRVLSGLGGALVAISFYIKHFKKEDTSSKVGINFTSALVFISIFTLYGLQKKDIRAVHSNISDTDFNVSDLRSELYDVKSEFDDMEDQVNNLESKFDEIEYVVNNLEYSVDDLENNSHYHY